MAIARRSAVVGIPAGAALEAGGSHGVVPSRVPALLAGATRRTVRGAAVAALAALLMLVVASPAMAIPPACTITPTITWTGAAIYSSWQEPTNWSRNELPGAADNVCIPPGATADIAGEAVSVQTVQSRSQSKSRAAL